MQIHVMDDLGALSARARAFLSQHGDRSFSDDDPDALSWFKCEDVDGNAVLGPAGGLARLQSFVARCGGLSFCAERPACGGGHSRMYQFYNAVMSGWTEIESGDYVAEVGDAEDRWPLTLSWTTERIGVVEPDYWIASNAVNLIESCAMGQAIYADESWLEAVPVNGKGLGWGLEGVASDSFRGLLPEVTEASTIWNRWYVDEQVAVHAWKATYEPTRHEAVMAWYRGSEGHRRIEAVAGPLRNLGGHGNP